MSGNLTPEQIEDLLKASSGGDAGESASPSGGAPEYVPSRDELDMLGEVYNMSMGNAATAAAGLIRMKVDITTPVVDVVKKSDLVYKSLEPAVAVEIKYLEGVKGSNTFILSQHDIMIIVDIMMGGSGQVGEDVEFTELHVSAVAEMMNQMMGSASKALSEFLQIKIDITPPNAYTLDGDYAINTDEDEDKDAAIVMAKFKFNVGDVINSEMILTASMEFTKDLLEKAMIGYGMVSEEVVSPSANEEISQISQTAAAMSQKQIEEMVQTTGAAPSNSGAASRPEPQPQYQAPPPQSQPPQQPPPQQYQQQTQHQQQTPPPRPNHQQEPLNAREVNFTSFDTPEDDLDPYDSNFDLVLDLPLNVTVEIGRTKKIVQEVLDWGEGSLIELDKQSGEPVDVYVNGSIIAKGNVIVIDEKFAVKITEIISTQEKLKLAKNEI